MKLPAITICFVNFYPTFSTNVTLDESLFFCKIDGNDCDHKDFYSFKTRDSIGNKNLLTCYVLNGGRYSTGHSTEIISTRTTGLLSGLEIFLYLPKDHFLYYYINDAYVQPASSEIVKIILSGTVNMFTLEKTIETKLEYPFNICWDRTNLPDTPLVRQMSAANITYRLF